MKYEVGDRVKVKSIQWFNENVNDDYNVVFANGWHFSEPMSIFCGKELIIEKISHATNPPHYIMKDNMFSWTDEMIEGLAQEYPKIAIQGDPAKGVSVIDALVALGGENEKDVIASTKHACYFIGHDGKIRSRLLENIPEGFKLYTLEEWRKENIEKENANKKELLLGLVETQKGQELIPHKDYEIKQDGDKFYLVKKKKEYPKTYEECLNVLGYDDRETYCIFHTGADERLFEALYRLKVCRDAYLQIAGEENKGNIDYVICNVGGKIISTNIPNSAYNHILIFPTEEMRDAFYENFKELIEQCKELL